MLQEWRFGSNEEVKKTSKTSNVDEQFFYDLRPCNYVPGIEMFRESDFSNKVLHNVNMHTPKVSPAGHSVDVWNLIYSALLLCILSRAYRFDIVFDRFSSISTTRPQQHDVLPPAQFLCVCD